MPVNPSMTPLCDVHSLIPFCRECMLVEVRNGRDLLTIRPGSSSITYDLYIGDKHLFTLQDTVTPSCTGVFTAGYGDGMMTDEAIARAVERLNAPFKSLSASTEALRPMLGLLRSGLYLVADYELTPCLPNGKSVLEETRYGDCDYGHHRIPLYPIPCQRASALNGERIAAYADWLRRSPASIPRAIALFLSAGPYAFLLDGHHRVAAAASLGMRVRTLVIIPLVGEHEEAVRAALKAGKRLQLSGVGDPMGRWHHLQLIDEAGLKVDGLSRGDDVPPHFMHHDPLPASSATETPLWGTVPEAFRPDPGRPWPDDMTLLKASCLREDQVKGQMQALRAIVPEALEAMTAIANDTSPYIPADKVAILDRLRALVDSLCAYAVCFPDRRLLDDADRHALYRCILFHMPGFRWDSAGTRTIALADYVSTLPQEEIARLMQTCMSEPPMAAFPPTAFDLMAACSAMNPDSPRLTPEEHAWLGERRPPHIRRRLLADHLKAMPADHVRSLCRRLMEESDPIRWLGAETAPLRRVYDITDCYAADPFYSMIVAFSIVYPQDGRIPLDFGKKFRVSNDSHLFGIL